MKWEKIDNYHQRAKIFGGWLVKSYEDVFQSDRDTIGYDMRVAMCFVPDPSHEWTLTQEQDNERN